MKIIRIKSDEDIVLRPDAVLDVLNGQLLKNKALIIKGGQIKEIVSSESSMELKSIPLPGITLMPGLIDCHMHFALDGVDFHQALERWDDEQSLDQHVKKAAASFLNYGVTSVRDGSDKSCIGLKVRNRIQKGDFPGPQVVATGFALRRDGLYGTFLGSGVKDITAGRRQIRELAKMGVDQIKIVVSGIVSFHQYGKVGPVQFSLEELKALVEECHDYGFNVMAHASSDEAVRISALAGVDSVEHGYFVSDSSLELMAENNTAWVPTVVPFALLTEEPQRSMRSREEIEILEKSYQLHLKQVKKAADLGVRLGIGTDAGAIGVEHGSSYYHELRFFHEAGLSNIFCLQAATCQAARIIGQEQFQGVILPSMLPAMTGVRGNPMNDLSVLKEPSCVVLLDTSTEN